MKQSSSFFSSKHSALVLGLMLGASALVGSIAYAQLSIPSTIENMRITIRQIFLSEKGVSSDANAPVVLDGTNGGTIKVNKDGLGNGGNITAAGTITTQNLVSTGNITFTKLKCSEAIAAGQRFSQSQSIAIPDPSIDDSIIDPPIEGGDTQADIEEIYCVLMTDANGTVHIRTRDQFNERMSSTNGDVFKRNPSNANDSFFATASGEESTVNNNNFLRVGATDNNNTTAAKPDTAMVVAGSIESRGGNFIRKVDGQQANEGDNLKVNLDRNDNYTSLNNVVEGSKVNFESARMNNRNLENTQFTFTAEGAQTSLGINTTNPEATLHVAEGGTVQFGSTRVNQCFDTVAWNPAEYDAQKLQNGEIYCIFDSYPTLSVDTDRSETYMNGRIRTNWSPLNDSYYNNYQLPTGVYPPFMDVVRPSWSTMISAGHYWHNGSMNVGTNVRDARSMFNANTATIQNELRVGIPDRTTSSWLSVPLEVNGNQVQLAEFIRKIPNYPTTVWDSTALIDIVNGAKVRWSYGVGGTGYNNLSMNDSQFYIEREGAGSLFTISSGGRVGIGTNLTTPQKKLDVRGNASITENLIIGHDAAFDPGSDRLNVNGSARANAYYYNSDAKYKSDITPLTSALDKILKLNGYSYYNKLSEKNDIGVIAQEVEKVFPSLVQTDADGYKSVAYGNLVAPLIEAVKELSAKIDELFDKYVDQQAQIDALEARIQALENNK